MAREVQGYLYNPKTGGFGKVTVTKLEDYYHHINCRTFDVVRLDADLNIYVDDEGLLVSGNYVTAIINKRGIDLKLAGNLLFTGGVDNYGNTLSIDYEKYTPDYMLDNIIVPTDLVTR